MSPEVEARFGTIYYGSPLKYPSILVLDDGREFYGDTAKFVTGNETKI